MIVGDNILFGYGDIEVEASIGSIIFYELIEPTEIGFYDEISILKRNKKKKLCRYYTTHII